MVKQLIILGNGFDLSSGLKSSYNDFFKWYLNKEKIDIPKIKSTLKKIQTLNLSLNDLYNLKNQADQYKSEDEKDILNLFSLNSWFFLFFESKLNKKSDWFDVESQINYYLDKKILHTKLKFNYKVSFNYFAFQMFNHDVNTFLNYKTFDISNNSEQNANEKEKELVEFFFKELNNLEGLFEKFLFCEAGYNINSVDNNYFENSMNLLSKLVKADTANDDEYGFNILNFNYTDSFDKRWKSQWGVSAYSKLLKPNKYFNVHGEALRREDNVNRLIFGIDNDKFYPSDPEYIFTKTFRTLLNYSDTGKPIRPIKDSVFDDDVEVIKFFGHSLAEADYSYFQQMFDQYDLYNTNLKLIFYFIIYDDRSKIDHLREQISRVTKLIDRYGATLDNKDHGKNLLTKLEMTKRISIKQIL